MDLDMQIRSGQRTSEVLFYYPRVQTVKILEMNNHVK
jgi:hypothetical protein